MYEMSPNLLLLILNLCQLVALSERQRREEGDKQRKTDGISKDKGKNYK